MKDEEKKGISLWVLIIIAILLLIIGVLTGLLLNKNFNENVVQEKTSKSSKTSVTNNKNNDEYYFEDEEIEEENYDDIYENYSEYTWYVNDKSGDKTKYEITSDLSVEIINSKLYVVRNGEKELLSSVKGTPKYVLNVSPQSVSDLTIIMEDGSVYKSKFDYADEDSYTKLNSINGKVIDVTLAKVYDDEEEMMNDVNYFLLSNGKIVDKDGKVISNLEE